MTKHRSRQAGMTLLELLLSMAITGLVAAGVSSMLLAVSTGTSQRNDTRTTVVRGKVLETRLAAAIRGSRQVLARGSNYVVLWTGGPDNGEAPRLAELRRVEFDAASQSVWSYQAPASLSEAANTQYALEDNFASITAALKGGATMPGERWSQAVTAWSVTLDTVDAAAAKLVSYRITIASDAVPRTLVGAAALRRSDP